MDRWTDRLMNTVNRVLSNGMTQDAGLEPGETQKPIISQQEPSVPIRPGWSHSTLVDGRQCYPYL